MRRIDYDTEQYQDYARGRALTGQQLQAWISAFAAVLPGRRPLAGLDVGSGTGRFTPALARAFGPVTGVEPSVRMREIAQAQSQHPGVRYLAGSAEDMPVPSGSADYALMFLSWHHVQDKPLAARELARVLRPAGRLLLRANFSDHHPRPWWLEHFPRGFEADAALFQPLHEVIATFTSAGWRVASFGTVTEPSSGTRGDMLERLRLRTLSFFAQLSPDELEAGFRRLEQAVAADPGAPAPVFSEPLLTLERSGARGRARSQHPAQSQISVAVDRIEGALRRPGELTATVTATTATSPDQRHTSAVVNTCGNVPDLAGCHT